MLNQHKRWRPITIDHMTSSNSHAVNETTNNKLNTFPGYRITPTSKVYHQLNIHGYKRDSSTAILIN